MTRKGLIFDFDGTMAHLFAKYDWKEKKTRLHDELAALGIWHSADAGIFAAFDSVHFQTQTNPELMKEGWRIVDRIITEAEMECAQEAVEIKGSRHILRKLSEEGWVLGVSTNNSEEAVRAWLDTNLPDLKMAVSGRIPGHPEALKPSPDSIVIAAGRMGIPLSSCTMIGDNPRDWEASCNAGIPFIAMSSTEKKYFRNKEMIPGVVQVRSFDELHELLTMENR